MTVTAYASLIGRTGTYRVRSMDVPVRIADVRVVYGRTEYQIVPRDMEGDALSSYIWVSARKVRLTNVTRRETRMTLQEEMYDALKALLAGFDWTDKDAPGYAAGLEAVQRYEREVIARPIRKRV